MTSVQIRKCEAADAGQLDWSPHQHYREHFERQFARQQERETLVLVARDGAGLVGRVIVDFTAGEAGDVWVYALGVREAHRRRGVGTALMRAAAAEGLCRGATRLALTVEKSNDVVMAFYQRLGLTRTGEDMSPGLKANDGSVIAEPVPRWILDWSLEASARP